jgi:hypothetical protein
MSGPTPGLPGPWDNRDSLRLQRRSYALLGTFLRRDDLPVLEWVVSQWSLTAKVTPTDGINQWDVVEAWATALGLQVQTHAFADFARVAAVGKLDGEGGHVEVGIIADIYGDGEGGL